MPQYSEAELKRLHREWDDYITEFAQNAPTVSKERLDAVRTEWHDRHGLRGVFAFPWGKGTVPKLTDPAPEAENE